MSSLVEPGIGKTILALHSTVVVARSGGFVVYLDFENDFAIMKERMFDMGLTAQEACRIIHWEADGALVTLQGDHGGLEVIMETIGTLPSAPVLIVLDGVGASITMAGGDENSNRDAQRWEQLTLRPLLKTGAGVLCVDHIPHPEPYGSKRRAARGASAKLGDARGHVARFDLVKAFSRTQAGEFTATTIKDRGGYWTMGAVACHGHVTPPDHSGSPLIVQLTAPKPPSVDASGNFWPTGLMERSVVLLDAEPGLSTSVIVERLGSKVRKAGQTPAAAIALRRLEETGFVTSAQGRKKGSEVWTRTDKVPLQTFENWRQGPPEQEEPF